MKFFGLATSTGIAFSEIHAAGSPEPKLAAEREGGIRRSVSLLQKMNATAGSWLVGAALLAVIWAAPSAMAQPSPSGPPVVGVIKVERRPMTDSYEFNGRIQAINSVNIIARVTAFLDQQLFTEGTDVKKGDLLYTLERPPFQAAVDVQKAAVAQAQAQLENSNIELWRKQELLEKSAGSKQALDSAQATQRVGVAQLQSAQAQLERAQIDLGYTEIRSPIDGRIGRTSVTVGNMVGQTSGTLTTVVSQDPMYVVFPVPTRRAIELREEYSKKGGFDAVKIRLRLPDGRIYGETGKLDFINNAIAQDTDTFLLRGVISNPVRGRRRREVSTFASLWPTSSSPCFLNPCSRSWSSPCRAPPILADQQGSYVYVVDDQNIARQRRVRLGQVTPETAGIVDGLKEGEQVVVEGVQRARPNSPVTPAPATSIASRS